MTATQAGMLKAMAFVLVTLGATGVLVAAGLAEDPPAPAGNACLACLWAPSR